MMMQQLEKTARRLCTIFGADAYHLQFMFVPFAPLHNMKQAPSLYSRLKGQPGGAEK